MKHVFQDLPMEMAEMNPFARFGLDWALLVTEKDGKTNGMTIAWGGMGVMWDKNVAYVFVRGSRYTKELLDSTETFSVNFFGGKEKNALKYFGKVSGRDEDKFANVGFGVDYHKGIAFADESNFVVVCKTLSCTKIEPDGILDPTILSQFYPKGDFHYMYVGEIVEFLAR
ncbi:MAG: flavin reductase [Lachnospiraceae bacterium]|nr:flavin reductase [Lachnospiraceae bacterium]